jgi:hypothetical protein
MEIESGGYQKRGRKKWDAEGSHKVRSLLLGPEQA